MLLESFYFQFRTNISFLIGWAKHDGFMHYINIFFPFFFLFSFSNSGKVDSLWFNWHFLATSYASGNFTAYAPCFWERCKSKKKHMVEINNFKEATENRSGINNNNSKVVSQVYFEKESELPMLLQEHLRILMHKVASMSCSLVISGCICVEGRNINSASHNSSIVLILLHGILMSNTRFPTTCFS